MSRMIRCSQGSDLWNAARVGRITGSRVGDLLAPPTTRASTRGGVSFPAGTENLEKAKYRRDLVIERIYGRAANHVVTSYMRDGSDREEYARILYEAYMMTPVELVGFALHPEWDWFGSSADGLVGEDGGVELKCPTEGVHDSYAIDINLLVEEYKGQVLGNLICFPEREWWDLASFQPYAPDSIKLLIAPRFHRSDWSETITKIETEAQEFNAQIEAEIAKRGLPPTVFSIMPQQEQPEKRDVMNEPSLGITDADIAWVKEYQEREEVLADDADRELVEPDVDEDGNPQFFK